MAAIQLLALVAAVAVSVANGRRRVEYNMPEYAEVDRDVFLYESIVPEDIWEYNVVEAIGVAKVTEQIYMEEVYTQRPGDKPWLICIIVPGGSEPYSSTTMKTLYFLQRDFADKARYGWIDTRDEQVREAFENEGVPQCVYIKDGKPYYAQWDSIWINRILEFIERHQELKEDAFPMLQPVPSKLSIYPQYYLKWIGGQLRNFSKFLVRRLPSFWRERLGDEDLEYYPSSLLKKLDALFFTPYPKTAAKNFIQYVVMPLVGATMLSLYFGLCCCCCCLRKPKREEVLVD